MDLYSNLMRIQASDPDGGERKPTDADYARHKEWAIATFGQSTWSTYSSGNWADLGNPGGGYYIDEDGF